MSQPKYLTTAQAAALANRSVRTIQELAKDGTLESIRPGRDWLISEASVIEWAKTEHKPGPKPKPREA